jgi:hypothetical protein
MHFSDQADVASLPAIEPQSVVIAAHGAVLGCSRALAVDRVIYVVPAAYGSLPTRKRYQVASLIGRLAHTHSRGERPAIMLVGPGRWGTEMPELGVPVTVTDINTVSVLCEVDAMHEGLIPDLSLGTHFFHELVETDMLYLGYFRSRKENKLNLEFLEGAPNHLEELLPEASSWSSIVRVLESPPGRRLRLVANHMRQEAVLYIADQ